ncbi:MAG: hypothetical protein JW384_00345 [Nitrosomonadaceae bacterium]|nr:hypothetical protein [Nitrosomonadaceae bacterium]
MRYLASSPVLWLCTIALFSLSFWSSGVFLIRALTTYGAWDESIHFAGLCIVSVPVAFLCVAGVRRMLVSFGTGAEHMLYAISGVVLLAHGCAIGFYPSLYGFVQDADLRVLAWLLWFGGVVVLSVLMPTIRTHYLPARRHSGQSIRSQL